MTYKPDICLYHANCSDGFTSAWVVQKAYPDVYFYPVSYGADLLPLDYAGKNVLIVDFTYPPDTLEELAGLSETVTVLDHHKTGQANLAGFKRMKSCSHQKLDWSDGNVQTHFDMDKAGCHLAWNFCFPGELTPLIVNLVEDRDLWRFAHGDQSRQLHAYLKSEQWTFDLWARIHHEFEHKNTSFLRTGAALMRFEAKLVDEACENAFMSAFAGHQNVPVVHSHDSLASEIGHRLLQLFPNAPFAAVRINTPHGVKYSLRSVDDRQDVSEVAKLYGGGGHRNAAGMYISNATQ